MIDLLHHGMHAGAQLGWAIMCRSRGAAWKLHSWTHENGPHVEVKGDNMSQCPERRLLPGSCIQSEVKGSESYVSVAQLPVGLCVTLLASGYSHM